MYSGLSVGEVATSDVMVQAVAEELATYWTTERELLASILEMLHVLVLTTQAAHGGKNLPKPLSVQRPSRQRRGTAPPDDLVGEHKAPLISMSEFVRRDKAGLN